MTPSQCGIIDIFEVNPNSVRSEIQKRLGVFRLHSVLTGWRRKRVLVNVSGDEFAKCAEVYAKTRNSCDKGRTNISKLHYSDLLCINIPCFEARDKLRTCTVYKIFETCAWANGE
jgi:hypothetical protein